MALSGVRSSWDMLARNSLLKLVRDVLTFKGYEIIEAETGKRASAWPKSDTRAWS